MTRLAGASAKALAMSTNDFLCREMIDDEFYNDLKSSSEESDNFEMIDQLGYLPSYDTSDSDKPSLYSLLKSSNVHALHLCLAETHCSRRDDITEYTVQQLSQWRRQDQLGQYTEALLAENPHEWVSDHEAELSSI